MKVVAVVIRARVDENVHTKTKTSYIVWQDKLNHKQKTDTEDNTLLLQSAVTRVRTLNVRASVEQ